MDSPLDLTLFGVHHMDSPGKVTRELDAAAEDVDAIFVEYPERMVTPRELTFGALRAPTYLLGLLAVHLLIQRPLFLLFNRDLASTEIVAISRVIEDRELPVHRVDDTIFRRLLDVGIPTTIANWLVLGVVVWLAPVAAAVTTALLLVGFVPILARRRESRAPALALALGWYVALGAVIALQYFSIPLAVVGFFAFAVVVRQTLDERNEHMIDRVADDAAEHGYEKAVLVTGKSHLAGLAERAAELDLPLAGVHVSMWRSPGAFVTGVDPANLPDVGDLSLDVPGTTRRLVVPGSEQSVLGKRLLAGAVDLAISLAVGAAVVIFVMLWPDNVTEGVRAIDVVAAGLVLVPFATLMVDAILRPLADIRMNASPGKRLVGLAVADADDHGPPSTRAVLVRGLLRAVDGFGFYAVGALVAAASDRNQRLGDHAAGTVVGRRYEEPQWAGADVRTPQRGADDGSEVDDDTAADERDVGEDAGEDPGDGEGRGDGETVGDETVEDEVPTVVAGTEGSDVPGERAAAATNATAETDVAAADDAAAEDGVTAANDATAADGAVAEGGVTADDDAAAEEPESNEQDADGDRTIPDQWGN